MNFPFYVGLVVQWIVSVGVSYLLGIYFGLGLVGRFCVFLLVKPINLVTFAKRRVDYADKMLSSLEMLLHAVMTSYLINQKNK